MSKTGQDAPPKRAGSDRRAADRRAATLPFEGPERRRDDRRSGADRRAASRVRLAP